MNQHDQMREALESILRYPKINEYIGNMLFNKAMQALSHVNETPKNEHDSADVLKPAKLVRLTGEELSEIAGRVNKTWLANSPRSDIVPLLAAAISGALEAKNGGSHATD